MRGEHQHAVGHALGEHVAGALFRLDAQHQALAADALDAGGSAELLDDVLALGLDVREELAVDAAEDVQRAGADRRVAAEGGAVRAGTHGVLHLFAQRQAPIGRPPPRPFAVDIISGVKPYCIQA